MVFTIPGKLPTLNEYTNSNRTHWGAGATLKKEATKAAEIASSCLEIPDGSAVILHYDWHISTRHDLDNIAFAQKFVQDGIVSGGKLPNDNRKYIRGFTHKFTEVSKGRDCVVVEVEIVK